MTPIRKIFIANRGEIAVRIIKTARLMGIETVIGVSEADRDSLGARLADKVICLGPAPSAQSYLNVDLILHAARATGCDAIHPGYGFLSENRALAQGCLDHDMIFIGPTPDNLDAVGDKLTARTHAIAARVPVVPGDTIDTAEDAQAIADRIGFPLLIKAVAGGGGKGMRRVDHPHELTQSITLAMAEATASFGDGRVYVERLVEQGRHIEVQIISDGDTILHAHERECSLQRRYQKVVEEAPAPNLDPLLRDQIHAAALQFARHIGYVSLGTVEFLVDVKRGEFYFLEMNARVQVEHPVTEEITGLDLIQLQIDIAQGINLRQSQSDITVTGHAIECRINAEDSDNNFMPSPGRITTAWFPPMAGLRIDTHVQSNCMIVPYYDSMIAKMIVHRPTRDAAITTLARQLATCRLDGITTNIPLHQRIMTWDAFQAARFDTNSLQRFLDSAETRT
jgi:acetyl-CoA carboxylase biotin carboxylase subunit